MQPSFLRPEPTRSGILPIRGVAYYYEVMGEGEPLLLLHGGLGSIDMFGPILKDLMAQHRVIGGDLHGHGRTTLGDRPLSVLDIADDLAVLLDQLELDRVDVLGYSLGGAVGFRLAAQHPERVRRLVMVSTGIARDAFYPEILESQSQLSAAAAPYMVETPMYAGYMRVAPNPADFPRLLDRIAEALREPYDWSEDARSLGCETMLIYGDGDMYRLEHIVAFYRLLGGGLRDAGWGREHLSKNRLAILPGLTHYDIFMAPLMVSVALGFLAGGTQAPVLVEAP
ncbi:MAG TPA: alpha/beta hydrolase [Myxococcota bacterium]|nr:alpha/beta hydrolase [Myxococcota bacterium]